MLHTKKIILVKKNLKLKQILIKIGLLVISYNVFAAEIPDYNIETYDQVINTIYKNPALKTRDINQRIDIISTYFLGKPYLNGGLGEGKSAEFDQEPLYRTDAFDCATYVSTVLALAESNNLKDFQKNLLKIQYKNAVPTFVNRLHFTSVDWNKENEKNGYIQDITKNFKDAQGKSIAKIALTTINKPHWYEKMTAANLRLIHPLSPAQEKQKLMALRNLSHQVSIEKSALPYLPLTALFDEQGNPNIFIFNQIRSGTIIEMVRPNWNLEKAIGTHLNVSHLGFAIRTSKGLMFREASSIEHRVVDIPLIEYLKNYLESSTVKGINVQAVLAIPH